MVFKIICVGSIPAIPVLAQIKKFKRLNKKNIFKKTTLISFKKKKSLNVRNNISYGYLFFTIDKNKLLIKNFIFNQFFLFYIKFFYNNIKVVNIFKKNFNKKYLNFYYNFSLFFKYLNDCDNK